MSQVTITNLVGGTLSLDLSLDNGNIAIRKSIPEGGSVDVGDECTVDDLNRSTQVQGLVAAGTISIAHLADAADIAEEVKLNNSVYMGTPIAADDDRIVVAVQIADGAQALAAQPDVPRNITMQLTDADDSVSGDVVAVGLDPAGRAVTETMSPDGAGGGKTLTGTKIFASVTSVTCSNIAGSAVGDNLIVGVGNVIGLPTDIKATTAVKYTSLDAVPVTPDAIAVGVSSSGVDVNGSTYDGTKVMVAIYNTGE